MYIALGQGPQPIVDKILMPIEKLYLCPFVASFKKIPLKSDLYIFFHVFIHVYSPGAAADNSLGSDFFCKHIPRVTLVICCKFLPFNDS